MGYLFLLEPQTFMELRGCFIDIVVCHKPQGSEITSVAAQVGTQAKISLAFEMAVFPITLGARPFEKKIGILIYQSQFFFITNKHTKFSPIYKVLP